MTSLISPSPSLSYPSTSRDQRNTRRKTSIMSLRIRRGSNSTPAVESPPPLPVEHHSGDRKMHNPSSYFDRYPKKGPGPSDKEKDTVKDHERPPLAPPIASPSKTTSRVPRMAKEKKDSQQQSFAFPSVNQKEGSFRPHGDEERVVGSRTRPRTRTNPGQLRFSGSSTQTQYETPPQTPIEYSHLPNLLDPIHVVVAAPIAGVETMDALVDGMNNFDDDSLFKRIGSASSKIGIGGHHPLYHPPLPTPPPGITLGGGKPRVRTNRSSASDEDSDSRQPISSAARNKHRPRHPSARSTPTSPVASHYSTFSSSSGDPNARSANSSIDDIIRRHTTATTPPKPKIVVPSISEIIRKNAPPSAQIRSRPSTANNSSHGHTTLQEESEPEPEPVTPTQEADLISRSSIDSIAEEVQLTLRNHSVRPHPPPTLLPLHHAHSFPHRPPDSLSSSSRSRTPLSDEKRESSLYSSSASTYPPQSPLNSPDPDLSFTSTRRSSPKEVIATYLRSKRLTTLLKLTRHPHASREHPLTVSLSDLGSPTGIPVVVFLGLGCVRYVMGLYDEMAECLGLRLITIDRWGLGRTSTPRSGCSRGIPEWASVVDEVLDLLRIDRCGIMAHSAGAPYALSFANRYPERVVGDVCLLAPWVGGGEGAGYRWLRYIPNSLLKTAQAAEWKVQAWMLGKPPTITYEGIGYNVKAPLASSPPSARGNLIRAQSEPPVSDGKGLTVYPSAIPNTEPRPSFSSVTLSDYDDLGDFEGRFESRSTLGPRQRVNSTSASSHRHNSSAGPPMGKRKPSKGFLRMWKGGSSTQRQPPVLEDAQVKQPSGRRLKSLKSMGSLRSSTKSASAPSTIAQRSQVSPALPEPAFGVGLGFDGMDWEHSVTSTPPACKPSSKRASTHSAGVPGYSPPDSDARPRAGGRRSISFTASSTSAASLLCSPSPSTFAAPATNNTAGTSFQTALGNALIAASHAESSKGTHTDLLQILNHDQRPWGFSYAQYPHQVQVWYGDKDERIAENAVRWMEHNMGDGQCSVKVVKGADHGLMYRSSVVVDVLEHLTTFWGDDE